MKYASITNSYQQRTIDAIKMMPQTHKQQWVLEEKIHGANFSFRIIRENGEYYGEAWGRKLRIDEPEKFYACHNIVDKHMDDIVQWVKTNEVLTQDRTCFAVYGEIFGGGLNGEKSPTSVQVQKEVQYSPNTEFLCFDMIIFNLDENEEVGGRVDNKIMHVYDAGVIRNIGNSMGIKCVPMLKRGTFDDLLNESPEFQSVVPVYLGYGENAPEENAAEGYVLRPMDNFFLPNGSRPLLKIKAKKFSEKKDRKPKTGSSNPMKEFTEEERELVEELLSYVTENRLRAVLSKNPMVDTSDMGRVIKEFNEDVYDEALENGINLKEQNKNVKRVAGKMVNNACATMIRSNISGILSNDF